MKHLAFITFFIASTVHAAYYVECGIGFNEDEATFKQVEFKASSADDIFRGKNSDVWSVALRGNWLANGKATAKVTEKNNSKTINIEIAKGTGFAKVGKRFEVVGMYDDYPKLNVYEIGGIAGGIKTATYECYTAID